MNRMKLLASVALIAIAAFLLAFSLGALGYAPPRSMDGRAVFLVALAIGGILLGGIGIKGIRRLAGGAATP